MAANASGETDIHSPDDAVFSYILSSGRNEVFANHASFSDLQVNYSRRTAWISEKTDKDELGIIGLCIDSHKEIAQADIPHYLLRTSDENVARVVRLAARLAGKFVVLYANKAGIYVIPDATASLPVYYHTQKNAICVSSCDNLVNAQYGYPMSKRALDIRMGSELSQPLPHDITLFDQIRCLLPNHYVNLVANDVVRYAPDVCTVQEARTQHEVDSIVEDTIGRVDSIIQEYAKRYDIVCPVSGGWDSRLVLSFLSRHLPHLECFTFKHQLSHDSGDLVIPPRVCAALGKPHRIIEDMIAPDEYVKNVEHMIGRLQSVQTINLAYTYHSVFKHHALINGDIIDQIGKSLLGNSLPTWCATENFFLAKQHNYSKYARLETREYLHTIRALGLNAAIYDLFAIENRCGRWAAQGSMIYSACGVTSLNIFNCREIIESWMRISRKQRSQKLIHRAVFARIAPQMMSIPFNPTDRIVGLLKKAAPSFLAATHAKYWLGGLQQGLSRSKRYY